MAHALDGARAKLDCAQERLDALAAQTKALVPEGKGTFMRAEQHPADKTLYLLILQDVPTVPVSLGVLLGEFLHDTRSALDHLVHELVVLAGATPHNMHQFPIFDAPADWTRKVASPPKNRRGMLDFIDPTHVAVIKGLQPYQPTTGLKSLATLRDLSNLDKHHLVHGAFFSQTAKPRVSAEWVMPGAIDEFNFAEPGQALENEAEIGRVRVNLDIQVPIDDFGRVDPSRLPELPENTQMNVRADLKLTTLFGPQGNERTRIRDLRKVLEDTRNTVERFASAFA